MPITKYADSMDTAIVGQIATTEDRTVKTRIANQEIDFGRAVVVGTTAGQDVKNIRKDKATLLFSADFVSLNVINLSVNGTAISPVTFDTDHDTTAALLVAAVDALTGFSCELDSSDANNRTFLITSDNGLVNVTVSDVVVTLGASQATGSTTYSSTDVFEGVAVVRHAQPSTIAGDDSYLQYDDVNVMTKGVIWVEVVATVAYGDSAYVYNTAGDNQGQFTNSSSGNLAVSSGVFKSAAVGTTGTPVLAQLELNLPTKA